MNILIIVGLTFILGVLLAVRQNRKDKVKDDLPYREIVKVMPKEKFKVDTVVGSEE